MRLEINKISSKLTIFLFVMISYGFVFSTFPAVYFKFNSTPVNIAFRGGYLFTSFYLIIVGLKRFVSQKYTWTFWFLILFVIIYSCRIFYDVFFQGIVFKGSLLNLMLFTYGGNFIPFLALAIHARHIDFTMLIKASYWVLFVSNFLLIIMIFKEFGTIGIEMFSGRLTFRDDDGGMSLNPITISIYGLSLALLSIYYLLFTHKSKMLFLISMIVGLILMIAGASRGPQVTFGLSFLYLIFVYVFIKYKGLMSKVKMGLVVISSILLVGVGLSKIDMTQISMYNRFAHMGEGVESDTSTREFTFGEAWKQFKSSPILGDAYLVRANRSYPHNIYLEVLMATGLVGAFFFLPVLFAFGLSPIGNHNQVAIYLMFLLPVFSGLFSGSLFFNPNLFSVFALMSAFKYIKGAPLKKKIIKLSTN